MYSGVSRLLEFQVSKNMGDRIHNVILKGRLRQKSNKNLVEAEQKREVAACDMKCAACGTYV